MTETRGDLQTVASRFTSFFFRAILFHAIRTCAACSVSFVLVAPLFHSIAAQTGHRNMTGLKAALPPCASNLPDICKTVSCLHLNAQEALHRACIRALTAAHRRKARQCT